MPVVSAQGDQVQLLKRHVPLLPSIACAAGPWLATQDIGILADIGHSVQNPRAFLRPAPGKGRAEVIVAKMTLRASTRSGAVSIKVPSRSKTIVGVDIVDRYPSFGGVARPILRL